MTRVVVAVSLENARHDLGIERSVLGQDANLVRYDCNGDEHRLASACRDAEVILADLVPLTRPVLERASQCRLISIAGVGFDNVDIAAASKANISVCAVDEYCTDEVADHVMLLILALTRRITEYHEEIQTQHVWQFDSHTGLQRLRDMTLGIVGFGKIGRAVARRASAFGMKTLAHDHHPAAQTSDDPDIRFCDFDTLLDQSDAISLNCGLTPGNRHLIDSKAISKMRQRPILINCARGGLIDEQALADALDRGQIAGAGLDVLKTEPPDLNVSPFAGRYNVILTPHMAFYSDASLLECRKKAAKNIRRFLEGRHEQIRKYVHKANNKVGVSHG